MNCDQAKPHLSAMAHGTLPPLMGDELSEHLTTCAVCRERVESIAIEAELSRETESKPNTWTSKLRALPRQFMGPQVSMAMVLLLMVGIGLLYLPRLRGTNDLGGSPLVDTGSLVGRNGAISPAAPLDLALDSRAHRIRTREEEEALAAAAAIVARSLANRDAGPAADAGDAAIDAAPAEAVPSVPLTDPLGLPTAEPAGAPEAPMADPLAGVETNVATGTPATPVVEAAAHDKAPPHSTSGGLPPSP